MPSSSASVESAGDKNEGKVDGRERGDEARNLPEGNAGQDVPDEGGCEPEEDCWDR